MKKAICLLMLWAVSTALWANEAKVKALLVQKGLPVTSVSKAPMPGWFEVFATDRIFYVDANARYLIDGEVTDLNSMRNLSQERLQKLMALEWKNLPLEAAFKTVKGKGSRKLAVFSDPDCPYCKRLEKELEAISDVTIYTLLFPLPSHPGAPAKAHAVWCSPNPAQSWSEGMLKGNWPAEKAGCKAPIDRTMAFAQANNINGTPTLVFANGDRIAGALPAAEIEKLLNAKAK